MAIPGILRDALERFDYAQEPNIIVTGKAWDDFARFNEAFRTLAKSFVKFPFSKPVEDDLKRFGRTRRILRSSFAQPDDPDVGLTDLADLPPPVSGELGELQTRVRANAAILLGQEHPGLDRVREMLTGRATPAWPSRGLTRVVVAAEGRAATERSLASLGIEVPVSWSVSSVSEARRAGHCAVTLIAGSPEYLVGWRFQQGNRSELVSWLFNAPASPNIVVVLWPGNSEFRSEAYAPQLSGGSFTPRVTLGGKVRLSRRLETDTSWVSPVRPPQTEPTDDAVDALDFSLPDGAWISFGIEDGRKPLVVVEDEWDLNIAPEKTRRITEGDILVVLAADENRQLRRQFCAEWIARESSAFSMQQAVDRIERYKRKVRELRFRDDLINRLIRLGMTDTYVRSQIARAADPETIAPQRQQNLTAIAEVVEFDASPADWEMVKALRGGFGYAGRMISDQLRQAVRDDRAWYDEIEAGIMARVSVTGLGTVTLAPVLHVDPNPVLRGINDLGKINYP